MIAPASVPPGGTRPSIAAIATRRVLIAVAHPRIAAGLEALLDAEHRYEVRRASSAADLDGISADAVIADAVFVRMNGAPPGIPAVVLLDASADRASLADRIPLARAWLTTASTGDELIAALDEIIATAHLKPALAPPVAGADRAIDDGAAFAAVVEAAGALSGRRSAPPPVVASDPHPERAVAPVAEPVATPIAIDRPRARESVTSVALLVFGVSCAAVSLTYLWMALRP